MDATTDRQALEAAHAHCTLNEAALRASAVCGCFYCARVFHPTEIEHWINDRLADGRTGRTARCPECGIDAVIASTSGVRMTEDFMRAMHEKYF